MKLLWRVCKKTKLAEVLPLVDYRWFCFNEKIFQRPLWPFISWVGENNLDYYKHMAVLKNGDWFCNNCGLFLNKIIDDWQENSFWSSLSYGFVGRPGHSYDNDYYGSFLWEVFVPVINDYGNLVKEKRNIYVFETIDEGQTAEPFTSDTQA